MYSTSCPQEEGGATSSSQKNGTQFGGLRVVGGETNELRLGSGFVPDQHSARFASDDGLGSTANQHHGTSRVIGHPGKSVLWKFLFKDYFHDYDSVLAQKMNSIFEG